MTPKPLTDLDDIDLVDSDQDCRNWPVVNAAGEQVGTVREMLVDTDAQRVVALVLDSGDQVPVEAISFDSGKVVIDGKPADRRVDRGSATSASGSIVVPVVEEQIRVGKRKIEAGGVQVTTRVETRPVQETVTLREERVNVERRPVDRPVGEADASTFEERTIDIQAHSEEAVVEKRARVVEEIVLTKEATDRVEPIRDTVRRTEVDVKNIDSSGT